MGGILSGVFTPTEAAGAAVVHSGGGEREAVLSSQVSESSARVVALEKQVEEARVASAKQAKVRLGVCARS